MRSRYLWIPFVGAVGFVALTVFIAVGPYWPASIFFLCAAILLAGCARFEYEKWRRRKLEQRWWAERKRGIKQPPLQPCCFQFGQTEALHDEVLCTREQPRGPIEVELDRLLFDCDIIEQEEDV